MTHEEFRQTQHNLVETASAGYAWPGGYPTFSTTKDGAVLCSGCVINNQDLILDSEDDPQWQLTSIEINWEDAHLTCDHCSRLITSAYGEDPEAKDEEPEDKEPEPIFPWDLPER